jgi:hypothetical protein
MFKFTLDFYAGALIAIDSAKTLGFPIDVEIYDLVKLKIIQLLPTIIQNNNLENANAIIHFIKVTLKQLRS